MATLAPYVANNLAAGQNVELKTRAALIWLTVGKGSVTAYEPYQVAVAGQINILGYKGDMRIALQLSDEDPQSKQGACVLHLNKHVDEAARYRANGRELTVDAVLGGNEQRVVILQTNNGAQTACKLSGKVSATVHLAPAK